MYISDDELFIYQKHTLDLIQNKYSLYNYRCTMDTIIKEVIDKNEQNQEHFSI